MSRHDHTQEPPGPSEAAPVCNPVSSDKKTGDGSSPAKKADKLLILLAESSPMLREKIAGVLGRMDEVWCIGQVAAAEDLVRAAQTLHPELILADLRLLDSPRLLASLRGLRPRMRIVGLVDSASGPYRQRAAAFGLDGVFARAELLTQIDPFIQALKDTRNRHTDQGG